MEIDLEHDRKMLEMREKGPEFQWFYYEHESEIYELFRSLNSKGIRERKLLERTKKILDKLRVKKTKNKESALYDEEEEDKEQEQEPDMMEIDSEHKLQPFAEKNVETLIFKGGDRLQMTMVLVWFGQKPPTKRSLAMGNRVTRKIVREVGSMQSAVTVDEHIDIDLIKEKVIAIEGIYTDQASELGREWAKKNERDEFL